MSQADCLHKHICSDELSYCSCNSVLEDFDWPANILMNDCKFSYSRNWFGSSSETQASEIASLDKIEDVFWLGDILLVIQASKEGPTQSSTNQKIPKRSAWNSLSSPYIKKNPSLHLYQQIQHKHLKPIWASSSTNYKDSICVEKRNRAEQNAWKPQGKSCFRKRKVGLN